MAEVKVKFSVIDLVSTELKKMNNSLNNFTDGIGRTLKQYRGVATVLGGAGLSFAGVAAAMNTCVQAAKEDELAQNKLNAALEYTSIALQIQSTALTENHRITNGEVVAVQEITARYFKNAEAVKLLTPAILNMAAATGKSTESIAEQFSSAIITGEGLRQYGIDLKDCSTEQERIVKLQKEANILFEDQAKAVSDAKGPLTNINTQLQELQGNIGGILLAAKDIPFLSDALQLVEDTLRGWNDIAFTANQKQIQKELKLSSDKIIEYSNNLKELKAKLERLGDNKEITVLVGTKFETLTKTQIEEEIKKQEALLGIESNKYAKKPDSNNGKVGLTEEQIKAQKKINDDLEKIRIAGIENRFEKERQQTIAHFKDLEDDAIANGLSTIDIKKNLSAEIKRIDEEETKFKKQETDKQLEIARKQAEEIQNLIKKNNEYRSSIEDIFLTADQLETKTKKKSIADQYDKAITGALGLKDSAMAERLSILKGQKIADVDRAKEEKSKYIVNTSQSGYQLELEKYDEAYGQNTDKIKNRFDIERKAANEHFNEMINLYGNTAQKLKEIEDERATALVNIDREEKKIRKENAMDFVSSSLSSLQRITEGNKKFSALNKTIAIASVTFDTVRMAVNAYRTVAEEVGGGWQGIIAGAAAAALVAAEGAMQLAKITSTKSYASGIRSSQGEYAQVHKDELIYLPRGSEVINKRESTSLVNESQMIVNMYFEDRTSETYKIMQKDIRSGKIDQLVREISRRQKKVI